TKAFSFAIRNLLRNKAHASLNLAGLALGISCCIVIFLILRHELSFDNFHEKRDRIYRVTTTFLGDETDEMGAAPFPVGEAMAADFAEVEAYTTISFENEGVIKVNEELFAEQGIAFVAPSFFDLFNYEWVAGSPQDALENPYMAVISESTAKKFFGDRMQQGETAIGKLIRL